MLKWLITKIEDAAMMAGKPAAIPAAAWTDAQKTRAQLGDVPVRLRTMAEADRRAARKRQRSTWQRKDLVPHLLARADALDHMATTLEHKKCS